MSNSTYVDALIKLIHTSKGRGYVAKEDIPKDTIIIRDKPMFSITTKAVLSELFQLLYNMILSPYKTQYIKELYPNDILALPKDFRETILSEFGNLRNTSHPLARKIHRYLSNNLTQDQLVLYAAKYQCNAFNFNDRPVILFMGTIMNHSCDYNVTFTPNPEGTEMWFRTTRDVKKGEELTDHYIDVLLPYETRQQMLLNRYGFVCNCSKCMD
jgi:hypothetical protein